MGAPSWLRPPRWTQQGWEDRNQKVKGLPLAPEHNMLQDSSPSQQLELHAGLADELVERPQFMVPEIELVEVDVRSRNDLVFQRPQHINGRRVEIGVEVHYEHFTRRKLILR